MTTKQQKAAYQKSWRQRQPPEKQEAIRAQIRAWHQRNRVAQNAKRKLHYVENRNYYLDMFKQNHQDRKLLPDYRPKMRHYRKVAKAKRRLRIEQTGAKLSLLDWECLVEAWESRCAYCADFVESPTQDHVRALSKGGEHTMENVVPACMRCNQLKRDRELGDFLVELYEIIGRNPWKG